MIRLVALACGLLCGAGFLISGLYDPGLVHEIHERDGAPLAFGLALFAIVVIAALFSSVLHRRQTPYLGGQEERLPHWTGPKPLFYAFAFGVGWGLAGYFPIGALVSAGALSPGAVIFLVSALFGMILADIISGKRTIGRGGNGSFG